MASEDDRSVAVEGEFGARLKELTLQITHREVRAKVDAEQDVGLTRRVRDSPDRGCGRLAGG
jgi:hypothetical protein